MTIVHLTPASAKLGLVIFFCELGTACPKAGKAAYSDAVRTNSNFSIGANDFFAFHTVLKSSEDYYEAMRYVCMIKTTGCSTWIGWIIL